MTTVVATFAALPDRLKSGMKIRTRTGAIRTVVVTSDKDHFDEPLVRLQGTVVGRSLFSRDYLAQEGCTLVEEGEGA